MKARILIISEKIQIKLLWMLGASALGRPRGMVWGGRREEGSGWGTHVYLWRIHFDIWQNEYNYVKFKNKIKLKKKWVPLLKYIYINFLGDNCCSILKCSSRGLIQ